MKSGTTPEFGLLNWVSVKTDVTSLKMPTFAEPKLLWFNTSWETWIAL